MSQPSTAAPADKQLVHEPSMPGQPCLFTMQLYRPQSQTSNTDLSCAWKHRFSFQAPVALAMPQPGSRLLETQPA
jgi:hypothetical protein